MLLTLPAVWTGLVSEDRVHGAAAQTLPWLAPLFGAPRAKVDAVAANYAAKDFGTLPWIAVDELQIAFLRPLSSALVHLDFWAWPTSPALMHAHSLLWYLVLLGAAAALYGRVCPSGAVAALASVFFAFDAGHTVAVAWIASRSVIVGAGLGLWALWAHVRARQNGWTPGRVLAPVLLAVALSAGEIALGVAAYFFAYTLALDRAPLGERLRSSAPWLAVVLLWAVAYRTLGYGAYGSGVYVDPGSEPLAFARELPLRWSAYAFAALTRFPSDFFAWATSSIAGAAIAAAVAAPIVALIALLAKRNRAIRFWLLGTALSAVAVCSTSPSDRVSALVVFGGVALASEIVVAAVSGTAALANRWVRWPARALAMALVAFHGVLTLLHKPAAAAGMRPYGAHLENVVSSAYAGTRPGQDLFVIDVPDYYTGTMIVFLGALAENRHLVRTRVLYAGLERVTLTRRDAGTLELSAPGGFLSTPLSRVYRGRAHPMRAGQGLQLSGAQIVVSEVNERGDPTRIELRAHHSLDGGAYRFVAWDGRRYSPIPMPSVGGRFVSGPSDQR